MPPNPHGCLSTPLSGQRHPGGAATLQALLRHRWSDAGAEQPRYTFLDEAGRPSELPMARLRGLAIAAAARLQAAGVCPGDRVLLAYPPDGLDFLVGFAGCMLAGAVAVPVQNPAPQRARIELPRLAHIAADCGAAVALTTRRYRALVRLARPYSALQRLRGRPLDAEVPALRWLTTDDLRPAPADADDAGVPCAPGDVAYLQYTSGSTGAPRGVEITHESALHNLQLIGRETEVGPSSVLVGWVPLFHDMGLVGGILNILYSGAALVFFSPMTFLARPALWLEAITTYRGTHIAGPDFGYSYLLARATATDIARSDLSSLRFVLQGGEVARPDTVRRLQARLGPAGLRPDAFHNIYGLAESTLYVCGRTRGAVTCLSVAADLLESEGRVCPPRPGALTRELVSSGAPAWDVDVQIVHPDERCPLGPDTVGEVWIASPSVSRGFWGRRGSRFQARLAGAGGRLYLRTGDLGFFHDGELYVCGRRKDLVIQGGRNLYPHDLEAAVIASHPGLRRGGTIVLSIDRGDRERLVVFAEVRDEHADAQGCTRQLAPAVRAALAEHHQVSADTIVFLRRNTVPKTSSGKLQRGRMRQQFLEGTLQPIAVVSAQRADGAGAAPLDAVRAAVGALLGAASVDMDATFQELGIDSIMGAQLLAQLGARLDRTLPPDLLLRHPTPRAVAVALLLDHDAPTPGGLPPGIRLASAADCARLEAYLSRPEIDQSFTSALSARPLSIAARVADRFQRGVWLLGVQGGEIRGCLALIPDEAPGEWSLSTLSVAPDARTSGLGEGLFAAALQLAAARGATALLTDSWAGNTETGRALLAAGFAVVAQYPDPEKRPDGVETVLYRKSLSGER